MHGHKPFLICIFPYPFPFRESLTASTILTELITWQGLFGIPSYWKLVFTGHSLGASLAILAATLAEAR